MSAMDQMNDRWGSVEKTIAHFQSEHKGEKMIYRSAGALFKRKGDTPFKGWTVFLNRRGNLIITGKRSYFSNPVFSGRSLVFFMIPMYISLMVLILGLTFSVVYIIMGSLLVAAICDLFLVPLIFLMIASIGINLYQRLPIEIDLEHDQMKMMYLGTYRSITRPCPMFSCFDGVYSYHFVGYRKLEDNTRNQIEKSFKSNTHS